MEKLSIAEEQALQALWELREANIKSILEQLQEPVPPYTTLASTVKNLEKKGYISSRLVGNMYLYRPCITEDEYKKRFMGQFIKTYFDNSYKELVNFFVSEKNLSKDELEEIIRLIEKK
ncbi:MAG: BlaI/MecI/CopY family transcriptional regulator [Flavihumibacter sp.]